MMKGGQTQKRKAGKRKAESGTLGLETLMNPGSQEARKEKAEERVMFDEDGPFFILKS